MPILFQIAFKVASLRQRQSSIADTIVSEIIAQLILRTFFAVISRSKITEITLVPMSAVVFLASSRTNLGKKRCPVPKLQKAIWAGFLCCNFAVKKLHTE